MAACPAMRGHSRPSSVAPIPAHPEVPSAGSGKFSDKARSASIHGAVAAGHGLWSPILRFPPNFVHQLSTKARRNCGNLGVAHGAAASWSTDQGASDLPAVAVVASIKVEAAVEEVVGLGDDDAFSDGENVKVQGSPSSEYTLFLNSDGSVAIHAGEIGGGIITNVITTPIVNTSGYFFKKTADLIDFKEKRRASFEYGLYGKYTTIVAEEKISTLEWAETTILMASGMCASAVMLMALVPSGIHLVTTTDCCRKTGIFIDTILPKMGITATIIDPANIGGMEAALEKNNVALFFTVSN